MTKVHSSASTHEVTIQDLPRLVTDIFKRAQRPILPTTQQPVLFLRYLRRKAGRGLAAVYEATAQHKQLEQHEHTTVSLTLDEKALSGSHILFDESRVTQARIEKQPSGVLYLPDPGISVQSYPADNGLPTLKACSELTPQNPLFIALQAAARVHLKDTSLVLERADVSPVRYKPASRCVLLYFLHLYHPASRARTLLMIYGKVYADAQQASRVHALQQELYTQQEQEEEQPLLPLPLGIVEDLHLTLTESAGAWDMPGLQAVPAIRLLQPAIVTGPGGAFEYAKIPTDLLDSTGRGLARLHTSTVRPAGSPRTGAKEAKRARERAGLIAGYYPDQAEEVQQLAQTLATRMEQAEPEEYLPAHGGFKASQLLFSRAQVFVVDFDGFCLADPALDVGYFLAYLRPSGLWYQRQGMRVWFTQAAQAFKEAYKKEMQSRGVAISTIDGIIERAQLYEAALLFKIATRRVNRLNSPRPGELEAMLQEISDCLA